MVQFDYFGNIQPALGTKDFKLESLYSRSLFSENYCTATGHFQFHKNFTSGSDCKHEPCKDFFNVPENLCHL